jgi:hypothetical protein
MAQIMAKTGASLWPSIKPEPVTITLNGANISHRQQRSQTSSSSGSGLSSSGSYDTSLQTSIINIPPTLHASLTFNRIFGTGSPTNENWYTYNLIRFGNAPSLGYNTLPSGVMVPVEPPFNVSAFADITSNEIDYFPKTKTATNYPRFPIGNFIISIDSQSYKYGLVRVTAVVAHITGEYV